MVKGGRSEQDTLYQYFANIMRNFDDKIWCSFLGVYISWVLFNGIYKTGLPFGHLIQE